MHEIKDNMPAGWMKQLAPNVDGNSQGFYWMWIVSNDLGSEGYPITLREPEVVLVIGHDDPNQRRVARTTGKTILAAKLRKSKREVVLWKGPLHCND